MAPGVRVLPFLKVFDPRAVHPDRNVMFFLARDRASMTADAAILVNDEAVAHSHGKNN